MSTTNSVAPRALLLCVLVGLLSATCVDFGCGCSVPVTDWEASLTGTNHVPPVTTSAAATGTFRLDSDGIRVTYTLTITSLPATVITSATLHQASPGTNTTTVAVGLCGTGGTVPSCNPLTGPGVLVTGTALVSPTQLTAMRAFGMYANVRTAGNPNGEIRGQLRVVAP